MYTLDSQKQPVLLEMTTFSQLNMQEKDIEEILRKNIEMLCDEDSESMLIVGQQVRNEANGRLDLTAVDKDGDLVLIEIKRDKADIVNRTEPFEVQAIRYAASCATINSTDELIQDFFAPYVEHHKAEFQPQSNLTSIEIAKRKLDEFFDRNEITTFNTHQKIILVASEFDAQTLSAAAWLSDNHVDISCYQLCPFQIDEQILIDVKKLLPVENYYVSMQRPDGTGNVNKKGGARGDTRRSLPKIDEMLTWGVVKAGDIILAKGTEKEAILREDGQVEVQNEVLSLQQWLKEIYGWASVQTYAFAVLKREGKTLGEIRANYMEEHDTTSLTCSARGDEYV